MRIDITLPVERPQAVIQRRTKKDYRDGRFAVSRKKGRSKVVSWIWLGRIVGRTETLQIRKPEEYLLRGMKMLDELKLKPYYTQSHLFLGELYATAGRKQEALENLKKAESMFQEMGMDYWLGKAQEALGRL
jgi:hypothetical protein